MDQILLTVHNEALDCEEESGLATLGNDSELPRIVRLGKTDPGGERSFLGQRRTLAKLGKAWKSF